jgi:hypothetical protein
METFIIENLKKFSQETLVLKERLARKIPLN